MYIYIYTHTQDIDNFPPAIALPIREALWSCRSNPPQNWTPEHYILIGRDDLSAPLGPRAIRVSGAEQESASGDRGLDFGASRTGLAGRSAVAGVGQQEGEGTGGEAAANVDGTRMDAEFDRLRFGRDRYLSCGVYLHHV